MLYKLFYKILFEFQLLKKLIFYLYLIYIKYMSEIKKYSIIEQPVTNYWKDEGGKNNNLHFKIKFINIKPKITDINISVSCNKKIIPKYDSDSKLNYDIKNIIRNLKNNDLEIIFKIYKVSKRFDHHPFQIILSSPYFNSIQSKKINVFSKRKSKRKLIEIKTDIIDNKDKNKNKRFKYIEDTYNLLLKELLNNKKELIDIKKLLIGNEKIMKSLKNENDELKERLSNVEKQIEIKEFSNKIFDNFNDNYYPLSLNNLF